MVYGNNDYYIYFIYLSKINANEFIKQFGNDVNIRNLGKDGYLSGTLIILLIALITAIFSILTAYLGFRSPNTISISLR